MWRLLASGTIAALFLSFEALATEVAGAASTPSLSSWLEKMLPPIIGGIIGYLLGRSGRGKTMLTPASADPPRIDVERSATFLSLSTLANYISPSDSPTISEKLRRLRQDDLPNRVPYTIRTLEWAERNGNENVSFSQLVFDLDLIVSNVGRKPVVVFLEPDRSRDLQIANARFRVLKDAANPEGFTIKEGETIIKRIKVKLEVTYLSDLVAFQQLHALSRRIASGENGGLTIYIPIRVVDFGTSVIFISKLEKRSSVVWVPVVLYSEGKSHNGPK